MLENLPRLYLVYSGFANFLNGSNIILNIPINAKNILILENNDNHLPRSGGHSGGKKMDVATFKKNGLRVKGETHYYYENNTIKAKSATGDWGDDVCLIYFEY